MKHYTVGMAGHIDHGKTTLTKALTEVDTDRLKEEKERNISIELGYAPLTLTAQMEVSLIDVPGHERFIRQMIAGVAGIDLVILVVAADEGVMPQTREHLDILRLLGIEKGIIVMTKIDRVDEEGRELAELDIRDAVEGTFLEKAELFYVDSVTASGIAELKEGLIRQLQETESRESGGAFRLPIDQVFTVHGQGTIVRGTVYEGAVSEGDMLELLPQNKLVRARQLQVHHQARKQGQAGQRVAINLGGISKEEIRRGDVLASSGQFETTTTIDIALTTVASLKLPVKQRSAVKLHLGTAEVFGKIVFFDRNELTEGNSELVCQLRLDRPLVTKRGDRFILRRPTPMETIGGGVVIDPEAGSYRFGQETVNMLEQKKTATPEERLDQLLLDKKLVDVSEAGAVLQLTEPAFYEWADEHQAIVVVAGAVTSKSVLAALRQELLAELTEYHRAHPLRTGVKKAELLQSYQRRYPARLLEWLLEHSREEAFERRGPYVALMIHTAHPPAQWQKRVEQALAAVKEEGMNVTPLTDHFERQQLPASLIDELTHYVHETARLYQLDDKHSVDVEVFNDYVNRLKAGTGAEFTLQEAKEISGLSRKYLVPFLEKMDQIGLTSRQEQLRRWRDKGESKENEA
ncbi:selenocysteine-specific translation elongation factor [Alkalihalobacillus oceani]|uniref:Selenocysteine-specific elongation factor n=1 Tax=Halalkalibacter oceani TaxID=1653776 RepID=A0A9X2DMA4_9BACI|nr:selenocysteine-specific translation elongation factor [Halalkalibacter oceani]MCM3713379.1 selenocysteine-specific translation elongation factor [Halalkalibacter oceani]